MPFVEVIYETGVSGIAFYDTEEEAVEGLMAHHNRAVNGQPGGPIGAPAERIKRALDYGDKHPNDYNTDDTMSADVALEEVTSLIKACAASNEGVIPLGQLAVEVRGLSHPMVAGKENPFDSNYKMQERGEITLPLEG